MASSLDKQLNEYRSRPKDQSGARRTKISLIYDPKEASFIDSETIFQIGYQGFTKLCEIDERFSDFGSSIFSYNNIQIDPIFLTDPENEKIFDNVESLLYLLSEYIMSSEAVQVLEYLIRQFAINRLRPGNLAIVVLPCLETSFFVRVIQTIPFKELPPEFKFLKKFKSVADTKKPINRKVLYDMIEKQPDLLHWIIKHSYPISELHPNGSFISFVGVLFTEIGLNSSNNVILGSIVETCRSSFGTENQSIAPHLLMAVAAINEKRPFNENVINKFCELILNKSKDLIEQHFRSLLMAAIYFVGKTEQNQQFPFNDKNISVDFIIALAFHIDDVDDISKKYKTKPLSEKFVKVIASNIQNDDLIRSAISVLETDFFCDVSHLFITEVCKNYVKTDYSEELIQSIASHYPTCLTIDVINSLSDIGIKIRPCQIAPRNLINQLSNPKLAGSLYSNPDLPFDKASSQVLITLESSKASQITEPIIPIINYFSGRATDSLLEYLCGSLFVDNSSAFSVALNKALSENGDKLSPYFASLPNSNNEILDHLIKYHQKSGLPDFHVLPLALARSISSNDPTEALQFLPIKQMNFGKLEELLQNGDNLVSVASDEETAAAILKTTEKIVKSNQKCVNKEMISLLLNFPNILCVAPILKSADPTMIISVFEETGPKLNSSTVYQNASQSTMRNKRIRTNCLYYLYAISPKVEDPTTIIPSLFMSLLTPDCLDEAMLVLRSIPSSNTDVTKVLGSVFKQRKHFNNEEALQEFFAGIAKKEKSRNFFDKLWQNVQTPLGCSQFWRLTRDVGIASVIHKFEADSDEIPDVLSSVLEQNVDNESLIKWAIDSLRPALIRASMKFLPISYINTIVPIVCSYPKYFNESFSEFFLNREIDCKILIPFLKENSVKTLQKSEEEIEEFPPDKLKTLRLKNKYVITPSTLILEIIPLSKNLYNIGALVPSLFSILKTNRSHHLVFPILNMCIQDSSEYMIKNFDVIIDSLSHSPIPHIHSSALRLIQTLASSDPGSIAKHTAKLFSVLSGSTMFSDDTANLIKIKQLLSSVLPVLCKTDKIDELIDYFAVNLDNFSIERSSQLIIHCINELKDDSYKIFYSLLKHKRTDFCLLIIDQLKPENLMIILNNLLVQPPIPIFKEEENTSENEAINDNNEIIAFILQIPLPPIPAPLLELFEQLQTRINIASFIEQTFNNFALLDFINVVIVFLPSSISIYSILESKLDNEPTPQFSLLLEPIRSELSQYHSLDTNLMILNKVSLCLTKEQSPELIPVINLILNTVEQSRHYTTSNKVQALIFMAGSIERFNLTLFEILQGVIDFAVDLYTLIINDQITAFISNSTASICLLLKALIAKDDDMSNNSDFSLCIPLLYHVLKLMISPVVIEMDEQLYQMVKESLMDITEKIKISSDLMKAFYFAYNENRDSQSSMILLFNVFTNSIRDSNSASINSILDNMFKYFFIAFSNKFNTDLSDKANLTEDDFEIIISVQDAIIESFDIFLAQLDNLKLKYVIRKTIDSFIPFMKFNEDNPNNREYISYRFMFTRIMLKITKRLEEKLNQVYEDLLRIDLDLLLMATENDLIDDGDFLKNQLTLEALNLFISIKTFAPKDLFNADYFNHSLSAILLHVSPVSQNENTQSYVNKIVFGLTPAFAALMDSTRDDQLWRVANQKLIDLTKSDDYRIKIAALRMADKAFEVIGPELTSILPELAPNIYELTEDSNNGVDQVARQTIENIQNYVGSDFKDYFS